MYLWIIPPPSVFVTKQIHGTNKWMHKYILNVCVHACACVCLSLDGCMYGRMDGCTYVHIYIHTYVTRTYVCMYILPAYGYFPGTFRMLPYVYNPFPTLSLLMPGLQYYCICYHTNNLLLHQFNWIWIYSFLIEFTVGWQILHITQNDFKSPVLSLYFYASGLVARLPTHFFST